MGLADNEEKEEKIKKILKKLLTLSAVFDILPLVARERKRIPKEMRYAEVSELADEQD